MSDDRYTRIPQDNQRIAPQFRNFRVSRATSRAQLICLSLLTICVFLIGHTVHAQDLEKQQTPDSEVSGFLGDYSTLTPDPKNGDLLLYEKDRSVLRKCNKFIFDPVTICLLPEAQNRGIDADDLERLATYFREAVTDELKKSGRYQIVTDPGPDVIDLRVAITNVEPTGGKKNAAVKAATTAATFACA